MNAAGSPRRWSRWWPSGDTPHDVQSLFIEFLRLPRATRKPLIDGSPCRESMAPASGRGRMRTAVGFGVAVVGVVWWASQQQAPRLPHSPERLLLLGLALVVYVVAILARCHRWM